MERNNLDPFDQYLRHKLSGSAPDRSSGTNAKAFRVARGADETAGRGLGRIGSRVTNPVVRFRSNALARIGLALPANLGGLGVRVAADHRVEHGFLRAGTASCQQSGAAFGRGASCVHRTTATAGAVDRCAAGTGQHAQTQSAGPAERPHNQNLSSMKWRKR